MMGGNDQFQTCLCDSGAFECPERPRLLVDAIRPRPLIDGIRPRPLLMPSDHGHSPMASFHNLPSMSSGHALSPMSSGHTLSPMLMLLMLPPVRCSSLSYPSPLPPPLSPSPVQVNVFVLLSVVCVLLNLAGFILCCQGAQLVSSMTSCRLVRIFYLSDSVLISGESLRSLTSLRVRFHSFCLCIINTFMDDTKTTRTSELRFYHT